MAKQTQSSGSETDVSTSTENLTPEEHYVLKTGIRQEPQGEETYLNVDGLSFNTNLSIGPMSNYMSPYLYGKLAAVNMNNNIYAQVQEPSSKNPENFYYSHSMGEQSPANNNGNSSHSPAIREKTEMMKNNNLASVIDYDSPYSNLNLIKLCQANMPNGGSPLFLDNPSVINYKSSGEEGALVNTDASINLQQPMLNNYLNSLKKNDSLMIKNFNADSVTLPPPPPPPPEYEKQWNAFLLNSNASKSCERLAISRSHPDLSKFADDELGTASPGRLTGTGNLVANLSYTYSQPNSPYSPYRNNTVEMILAENSTLRSQLDHCVRKVKNLQNVSITKVYLTRRTTNLSFFCSTVWIGNTKSSPVAWRINEVLWEKGETWTCTKVQIGNTKSTSSRRESMFER